MQELLWATKELFMALINDYDIEFTLRQDATLANALEILQSGYTPHTNFPTKLVQDQVNCLIAERDKDILLIFFITSEDWDNRWQEYIPNT